jgi:hypothetical protein
MTMCIYAFRIKKGRRLLQETVCVEAESLAAAIEEAKQYLLSGESLGPRLASEPLVTGEPHD